MDARANYRSPGFRMAVSSPVRLARTAGRLAADTLRGKGGSRGAVRHFSPISAAIPGMTTTSLPRGHVRYIYSPSHGCAWQGRCVRWADGPFFCCRAAVLGGDARLRYRRSAVIIAEVRVFGE